MERVNPMRKRCGLRRVKRASLQQRSISAMFIRPFLFNEGHSLGSAADTPDKVTDLAICHFMSVAGGTLCFAKPDITADRDMEYIATVTV
jgi:hypothetical protein